MKRVILSASILVSLIVLCIISLTALHSECLWYADLAGRTLYAAEQGDMQHVSFERGVYDGHPTHPLQKFD